MSWPLWKERRSPRYLPIGNAEGLQKLHTRHSTPIASVRGLLILSVLILASFIAGTQLRRVTDSESLTLERRSEVFRYNRTFADRPSNNTNEAWRTLFPSQGGYFRHPRIAPTRSAFAVFHQLHCLDAIRHGYWTTLDAALAGEKKREGDFPFMSSPAHMRHCMDLLRHALMCQADRTTEVKDEVKGGVTGFGVEHECVDWRQLIGWVERWESFGQAAAKAD